MHESSLQKSTKQKLQKPPMYMVLFHNDDYTTMEFVIFVLINIFNKPLQQAVNIMMEVHTQGISMVGIYTYEIATTLKNKVDVLAEKNDYPFLVTVEELHND